MPTPIITRVDLTGGFGGVQIIGNNGPDANGIDWAIPVPDGWDSAAIRRSTQDRAGHHGQVITEEMYSARAILLKGWAMPTDQSGDGLWKARQVCHQASDLVTGDGLLTVYEPASVGGPKYCVVRREQNIRARGNDSVHIVEFEVPLSAVDPRKYSTTLTSNTVVWAGGSPIPVTQTNIGDFHSWPEITIRGPGTNIHLYNSIAPGEVVVSGTYTASDTIVLTFGSRAVWVNGVPAYERITAAGWFPINPGTGTTFLSAEGGAVVGQTSLRVDFRSAWM